MSRFKLFPILKILLPFLAGILSYKQFPFSDSILFWVLSVLVLVIVGGYFFNTSKFRNPLQSFTFPLIYVIFYLLGVLSASSNDHLQDERHFLKNISLQEKQALIIKVAEMPKTKEKGIQFTAEVRQILPDSTQQVFGKISVFLKTDSIKQKIKYGDYLMIKSKINEIQPPKNSFQFDFKKFYAQKNIYAQTFVNHNDWSALNQSVTNPILELGFNIRLSLISICKKYFENQKVRGVVEAILFGYKDELDPEWKAVFSNTGVMHVLAVSGLHVGIIYKSLIWLLNLLLPARRFKWFSIGVVIIALFSYSLITGFSPSVSRASLMFGFLAIGQALQRPLVSFNSVFSAGFLLLIINPNFIYDLGFQFSFSAVLGILLLSKPLSNLWIPKSWFLENVWNLCTVSISAQIGVLPITLYYFNQFPTYFIMANLVVIPLVTLILYGGLLVVMLSWWELVANILSKIVESYVITTIDFVSVVERLSGSLIDGIIIDKLQIFLLYIIAGLMFISILWKSKIYTYLYMITIFIFLTYDFRESKRIYESNEVQVFENRSNLILSLKTGDELILVAKGDGFNEENLKYLIIPYEKVMRIREKELWYTEFWSK